MRYLPFIFLWFLPSALWAQCNGHQELCGKRYDQVAYLTTHNAYNAGEDGFALPNHNFGITRQLQDGVRGLMLDVYDEGGVPTVYHGFSFLGTATLESNLTEIKDFLYANPNEVVTIIFECYVNADMMESAFTHVGLKPFLHEQTLGEPWPTLEQMIDDGKRLVVLSDCSDAGAGQEWYHYVWDFAVETHFSNNSPSDFSCDFNRGDSMNDLFIVNHFVTDPNLGVGQPDQAAIVNELTFFYDRVYGCQLDQQKFPNFPTIDFHELGQTMAVVDSLNGVATSVGISESLLVERFSVYPNPSSGLFQIRMNRGKTKYTLFDVKGEIIMGGTFNRTKTLNLKDKPAGIYFLLIESSAESKTIKLVNLP